jgi:hypothetical protein
LPMRLVPALVLLLLLAAPGPAALASAKAPTVKTVKPLKAKIGDTLTLTGSGYRAGAGRNTVIFKRDGGPAVFVKAEGATATRLRVKVSDRLAGHLVAGRSATRFRVRVLTSRFGRSYTPLSRSPLITAGVAAAPAIPGIGSQPSPGATGSQPSIPATGGQPSVSDSDCDGDGIPDAIDPDDDNDHLSDDLERALGTERCNPDSDGDGVEDGFEHESALDLNSRALPYPGKRPYPNALDGDDAATDHDGDGLTLGQEHRLWQRFGNRALPLNYSDGDQTTGPAVPAPAAPGPQWLDVDGDGWLSDDEKDADGDGLGNWDEANGRMLPAWWNRTYRDLETPYPVVFAGTSYVDADSDGDGILDGADDNDFDGYSNVRELQRPSDWAATYRTTDPEARVHPFNPCKPVHGPTCHKYAPFDYYKPGEDW